MSEARRWFVGVKISMAAVDELRRTAAALGEQVVAAGLPPVRWVAPARYHITLKFLDWVQPEAFSAIRDALAPVLAETAEVRVRPHGLGGFPSAEEARVLWAGVEEPAPLIALARAVDRALVPLGFPAETRDPHPHITLGRAKVGDFRSVGVGSASEQTYSKTTCRSVCLFESDLKSNGSEYAVKWEWPLRSSGRAT